MSGQRTVAVTGGTGFTGGALVRRLASEGYRVQALARAAARLPAIDAVVPIEGELNDKVALERLVAGADTLFHIAAMYRDEGTEEEFLAANFESTRALIEASRAAGVRRFVYCSTIGVHGSVEGRDADEDAPIDPRDPYQRSKLRAEQLCREEMARGGLEIVIIRPCGIYGPGDMRMLKMFRMVNKGTFFFVGNAEPNFHPVYIDDLVQGFMLAMDAPAAVGRTYIVGSAHSVPLKDYAGAAARALGVRPPWIRIPYKPMALLARVIEAVCAPLGIQPPLHRRRLTFFKHNRSFSIRRARDELGYDPRFGLDEGFKRTVAWYRAQHLLPPARGKG